MIEEKTKVPNRKALGRQLKRLLARYDSTDEYNKSALAPYLRMTLASYNAAVRGEET